MEKRSMSCLEVRSNGKSVGKIKIYFTCHPADFYKTFEGICRDILKTKDCAIYYKKDMEQILSLDDKEMLLKKMVLFVVPITKRLLETHNPVMDDEIIFARESGIAILPIMYENQNLDLLYRKSSNFGTLQYLEPFSNDLTEIPYTEKLKKYLNKVLVNDETIDRIKKNFAAYIFLSYRKKDRKFVDRLMRTIHTKKQYYDIAIWYDEFLNPGEQFDQEIERKLKESQLFLLMVTNNLVNEENYVQKIEYPMAKSEHKQILSIKMEKIDIEELNRQYVQIPECVDINEKEKIERKLSECIKLYNNENPEHSYLIGLAYLEGIDVEVDKARAVKLITGAAEKRLLEAIEKIGEIYFYGNGVNIDYEKALFWKEKKYDFYIEEYGKQSGYAIDSLLDIANVYERIGDYKKVLQVCKEAWNTYERSSDKNELRLWQVKGDLSLAYAKNGYYKEALDLENSIYELKRKKLGRNAKETIASLSKIAEFYRKLGNYKMALELQEHAYEGMLEEQGEENLETMQTLSLLSGAYEDMGNYTKALELQKKVHKIRCNILGEENIKTVLSLGTLSIIYTKQKNYKKALELQQKVYSVYRKILGDRHPDTLICLSNLGSIYGELGQYNEGLKLQKAAYRNSCDILGREHPETLISMGNLSVAYFENKNYKKALEMQEIIWKINCKIFGEQYPNSIISLSNLAVMFGETGSLKKALKLQKKAYDLSCNILGREHPETLTCLNNLVIVYIKMKNYKEALELQKEVYELNKKMVGEEHPNTLMSKRDLDSIYQKMEKCNKERWN